MASIDKRPDGRYRARWREYPGGPQKTRQFTRKADAQRFLMEMEVDKARGQWIDPRGADEPLAAWTDEFLSLARRLAPKTQETYRRDLSRFVLPRFGDLGSCLFGVGGLPLYDLVPAAVRDDDAVHGLSSCTGSDEGAVRLSARHPAPTCFHATPRRRGLQPCSKAPDPRVGEGLDQPRVGPRRRAR